MPKNKTVPTEHSVTELINTVEDEQKRKDSFRLIDLMKNVSGYEPIIWGPNIIGFGNYHYKYESGHEGEAPLVAFSPRKAAFSLYVFTGLPEHDQLLEGLGKFKRGKACIYVKKMSDIDEQKLVSLIKETINYLRSRYVQH